jgi:hypothetical protein
MGRKFWTAFAAVYAATVSVDFLMKVGMWKFYPDLPLAILRPRPEMKLGLCPIGFLFATFFLTLLFSKLYKGTGLKEGLVYGMYVNLMMIPLIGLGLYAFLPIKFSLAFNWFLSRTVIFGMDGLILAAVYGRIPQTVSVRPAVGQAA